MMRKHEAPCGIAPGDSVPLKNDPRFMCRAVNMRSAINFQSLSEIPTSAYKRPQYIDGVDMRACQMYRGELVGYNGHIGFACPHMQMTATHEILNMAKDGYSVDELNNAIQALHPLFRSEAERAVLWYMTSSEQSSL